MQGPSWFLLLGSGKRRTVFIPWFRLLVGRKCLGEKEGGRSFLVPVEERR
jgi:hypothetical protein